MAEIDSLIVFVDLSVGKGAAAALLELSSIAWSSMYKAPELPPAIAGRALRKAPLVVRK